MLNQPLENINPNHIILHVGKSELKRSKTASQISRSVIDLALSLKLEMNTVTISLIASWKDNLNNKAHEVNIRLINMCSEHDITFVALKVSVLGVIMVRIFLAFSHIWTEYGEILRISPYWLGMPEMLEKCGPE